MIDWLADYRRLEAELKQARIDRVDEDVEDVILDEMDIVWWELTDEQRAVLKEEGPNCWPD
jgi:hypothetical protein